MDAQATGLVLVVVFNNPKPEVVLRSKTGLDYNIFIPTP